MVRYRQLAVVGAITAAGIQLIAAGPAAAADFSLDLFEGGSPDGCHLTGATCDVTVVGLVDPTTPVTFDVDGTVLATSTAPTGTTATDAKWTPTTAGTHVVTARQGTTTHSVTVNIVDQNSLEGILERATRSISSMSASQSATLSHQR